MNKKLILSLFALLAIFGSLFSIVTAATLFVSPGGGSVGESCIEEFNITLDMLGGEQVIASDIVIDSNMEFVEFINGDTFEYSAPSKYKRGLIKLLLFSSPGNDIMKGGNVGKVYFKVPSGIIKPYIKFVFDGLGKTTDTNLSIDGVDILSSVRGGEYTVDKNKTCVHNMDDITGISDENLDSFITRFESDNKIDSVKRFIGEYKIVLISTVVLLLLMLLFFLFKRKNK